MKSWVIDPSCELCSGPHERSPHPGRVGSLQLQTLTFDPGIKPFCTQWPQVNFLRPFLREGILILPAPKSPGPECKLVISGPHPRHAGRSLWEWGLAVCTPSCIPSGSLISPVFLNITCFPKITCQLKTRRGRDGTFQGHTWATSILDLCITVPP